MQEHHETFGLMKAAYTSPARSELVVDIPPELPYRRLYAALWFFGGVLTGRASASVTMESGSARGSSGSFLWEWGWPAANLTVPTTPLRYPAKGERNILICPPFSVQKIQPGEDCQWLQAAPLARDCMQAVVPDLDFPASFNVTMHPIPLVSGADRVHAVLDAVWTTDGGTFTECGCYLAIGVRSSIIPVS